MATRLKEAIESSPRTWGCFWTVWDRRERCGVFPTHVGVFPGISALRSIA